MFNNLSNSAKAHNKQMLQEILEDMLKEFTPNYRGECSVFHCEHCGRLLRDEDVNRSLYSAEDYYGVGHLFPFRSGESVEEHECSYCKQDPGNRSYAYMTEGICIFCGSYAPCTSEEFYFFTIPMCSDCLFNVVEFNSSFVTSVIKVSYKDYPSIRDGLLDYFKSTKFERIELLCYKHSDFQSVYADELGRLIAYVLTYEDDITFEKLKALGYEGDINSIIAMGHKFLEDYEFLITPIKNSYEYKAYIKGEN